MTYFLLKDILFVARLNKVGYAIFMLQSSIGQIGNLKLVVLIYAYKISHNYRTEYRNAEKQAGPHT